MFNHILLPTDGSSTSNKTIEAGLRFAKEHGATVTLYHALEPLPAYLWNEVGGVVEGLMEDLEEGAIVQAKSFLEHADGVARAAGVPCTVDLDRPRSVWKGILDAVGRNDCDSIFIGSHGRGGVVGAMLGSVALKVLSRAEVPIIVFRTPENQLTPVAED